MKIYKKILLVVGFFLVCIIRLLASDMYSQKELSSLKYKEKELDKALFYITEVLSQSPAESKFFVRSEGIPGVILVKAKNLQDLSVGQFLKLNTGKIEFRDQVAAGSYQNYLKLKYVTATWELPRLLFLPDRKWLWYESLLFLKQKVDQYFLQYFSNDVAGILTGILFGDTSFLSLTVKTDFRLTGLSHVMAISGANMTMIAEILFKVLFFVGLKKRVLLTVIILLLFSLFVGASAAVLRACIMGIIGLVAISIGKPYMATRALLVTVILFYFYSPYIVLFDVGFQLSVAATTGLLFLSPLAKKYLQFWSDSMLKELLIITTAAFLFTTPLTLYYFHALPVMSPLLNIVFVPLLELLSLCGYFIAILSLLPVIGTIFTILTEYGIRVLLVLINYASQMSMYVIINYMPSLIEVVLYYTVILILISYLGKRDVGRGKTSRVIVCNP